RGVLRRLTIQQSSGTPMPPASNETPGTGRGLGPKPPPTARRGTDDFAVVIGIDEYANLESLKGAVNDANAFYGWLCEKHGGGLERDNAKLILVHTARATLHQSEIDLEP